MRSSKLAVVISDLSERDRNAFRRYLDSPYFCKKKEALELYDLLWNEILKFRHKNLSETAFSERLWPGVPADINRLRKLKTSVFQHLMNFFALRALERHPEFHADLLMRELRSQSQSELLEETLRRTQKSLQTSPKRDSDYHRAEFTVMENLYVQEILKGVRSTENHLGSALSHFQQFTSAEYLRLSYLALNQKRLLGFGPDLPLLEAMSDFAQNSSPEENPEAHIWLNLILALQNPEQEAHFHSWKRLFRAYAAALPQEKQGDMITSAMNYCARKLNQGNQAYLREIFELFVLSLEADLILVNGELNPWKMKNMVSVAARLGEYEWATEFLRDYLNYLPEANREKAQKYNQAILDFHRGEARNAARLLNQVISQKEDPFYGLDARSYLLCIYFDTEDTLGLESGLESFRMYLSRMEKLPDTRKANYYQFLKDFRQLYFIPASEKEKLKMLQAHIESGQMDGGRRLLLERLIQKLKA